MRKSFAFFALLLALPAAARADGRVTLEAPYAAGDQITQCQWLAATLGLGVCTMSVDPDPANGRIVVDAQIASPDSPAGAHTLPTWGQAVAQGTMVVGYHLAAPAESLAFTLTWHVTKLHFIAEGLPQTAWTNAVAHAELLQIDCGCEQRSVSVKLSPDSIGADITQTIEVHSQTRMSHDPTVPGEYVPIPAGTFVIKMGFEAQAGLIMTAGLTRTTIEGRIANITVDEVDAPPPPAE